MNQKPGTSPTPSTVSQENSNRPVSAPAAMWFPYSNGVFQDTWQPRQTAAAVTVKAADHVENERNEVKPDRLPRGDTIARQICADCHQTGCPKTLRSESCQKCHHVHALINPAEPPKSVAVDNRLEQLLSRWKQFEKRMAEADRYVRQQNFQTAQACVQGGT